MVSGRSGSRVSREAQSSTAASLSLANSLPCLAARSPPAMSIGEPTFADAILDRIVHNAHRLVLNGPSMCDPNTAKVQVAGDTAAAKPATKK
jgi:hypothetical protein